MIPFFKLIKSPIPSPIEIIGKVVSKIIFNIKPEVGSVVYCELLRYGEHTGIYVGNNKIIHLDGSGKIERVSPKQFVSRLNGYNPTSTIYVSCNNFEAVGSNIVAQKAILQLNTQRKYNLLFNNCHRFTASCLIDNFESVGNSFSALEIIIKIKLGSTGWKVWNY